MMSGKMEQNHATIDTSRIEAAFANVFEVLRAPGEIVLAFGNTKAAESGRSDVLPANLANRIILSPYIAKRLTALLNNRIQEYESVFGPLTREVETCSAHENSSATSYIPRYVSAKSAEKADALNNLFEGLDVEYCLERSFKISDRSLLMNRFLMGFKKDELSKKPDETLSSAFSQMGMPDVFKEECSKLLPQTEFIHFGFEEQQNGCLYKVYLEFKAGAKFGPDGVPLPEDSFDAYLGFKWNPFANNFHTMSRYTCFPLLSLDEIHEKLSCMFERNPDYKSFETAQSILNSTSKVISGREIIYQEVSEVDNPRKSFDINLYDLNLFIRDIYSLLIDIGRHYSLPVDQFIPFYDRISDKRFGHLSGGIDREGKDFLTVYYGVESVDNRRRQHA